MDENQLPKQAKVDLRFINSEDLINELTTRYDGFIMAGIKFMSANGQRYEVKQQFWGNRYVCVGLAVNLSNRINDQENEWLNYNKGANGQAS